MIEKLRSLLGMDRAVAYTFLARSINILGSTGTVLLIVRFLSPVEQGYYYTLLSLVSLQLVFELGFSFVIQQLAAHECVHLKLHRDGSIHGDPAAQARLASALQLSVRWYTVAAAAMVLILVPLGAFFFARHATPAGTHIAWRGPWYSAVIASAASLWLMPFYSFLEGCGNIRSVAVLRFHQAAVTAGCAWIPLLLNRGLYSPTAALVGYIGAGALFVARYRRFLTNILVFKCAERGFRWNREVWPFQWRIAISSTCSYFAAQVLIPMVFALRGPIEAGQIGVSLSITGYMAVLALAWVSTKATPFGSLIAQRAFGEADHLFRRTLLNLLVVFAILGFAGCLAVMLLPVFAGRYSVRILPAPLFAALVLGSGANSVIQSIATFLRSFKLEPFLIQSCVVAALTLLLANLTARRWGNAGIAYSYLIATGFVGMPLALAVFVRARRRYLLLAHAADQGCSANPVPEDRVCSFPN